MNFPAGVAHGNIDDQVLVGIARGLELFQLIKSQQATILNGANCGVEGSLYISRKQGIIVAKYSTQRNSTRCD